MAVSLEQFSQRLSASGLVSAEELREFQNKLPANRQPSDAQAMARELIRAGKLTKYQAAAIYQGRTKGLVLGNYQILDKLGSGGMGQVFKALHCRMERVVALKVLPAEAMKSPDAVQRFHREVKAAARLEHSNIVTAYDADEADGVHFLVMQFVDGKDLSQLLKASGPLPVPQAVECIRQTAIGLAYAHRHGVIHRDIKPANLLLDRDGTVKILDMGLARLEDQIAEVTGAHGLTQSGQIMGTVDYMSPEQAEETRGVDARADMYSLGCTLWVLLTGRPIFQGSSTIAKLMAHRTQPAPSLRESRADVPEALDAIYRRMVAKDPADRFSTMDELVGALNECLDTAAPATIDRPSSSDSALTNFLQSVGEKGVTTSAPPGTKVDGETIARQPVQDDTGVRHAAPIPPRASKTVPPVAAAKSRPIDSRQIGKLVLLLAGIGGGVLLVLCMLGVLVWMLIPRGTTETEPADVAAAQGDPQKTPPANPVQPWINLFDGTDTSQWQSLGPFVFVGGELVASGPGMAVSRQSFDDFELEFQWKVSPGGNGGVFYRSPASTKGMGTEFQLVDNVGHSNGRKPLTRAGSLYNKVAPQRDAAKPTGQWNDARIVCRGKHVEHWLNGVQVLSYDTEEIGTDLDGHILLQGFSGTTSLKNIRLRKVDNPLSYALEYTDWDTLATAPLRVNVDEDFCLEVWVTPSGKRSWNGHVIHLGDELLLKYHNHAAWTLQSSRTRLSFKPSDWGRRIHVAVVKHNDQALLFFDGKQVDQAAYRSQSPPVVTSWILIGTGDGRIDEARVSQSARYTSDFEPQQRFASDAETIAVYHFDEGAGSELRDSSGNQHHAKIMGARWVQLQDPINFTSPWQDKQPPLAISPFYSAEGKAYRLAWARHTGLRSYQVIEFGGSVTMSLELLPPGEFMMGWSKAEQASFIEQARSGGDPENDQQAIDEISAAGPLHRVRITQPFYMGVHEVTQAQWQAVMGNNPSRNKDDPSQPVEGVSWHDVQSFVAKMNADYRQPGMKFVLPSEAEWEYACRAGTTTLWHSGDSEEELSEYAWFGDSTGQKRHPVGNLRPNGFGLFDMHGNVFEWCADWYAADYYEKSPTDDPRGPAAGTSRVFRGGSIYALARGCRSAHRRDCPPDEGHDGLGFRLAAIVETDDSK